MHNPRRVHAATIYQVRFLCPKKWDVAMGHIKTNVLGSLDCSKKEHTANKKDKTKIPQVRANGLKTGYSKISKPHYTIM